MTHAAETSAPEISVVVLCYRSGRDLVPVVERLHQLLSLMKPAWEMILVGNYLPDRADETPEVVRELEARFPHVRAITREKQSMMGWDMRTGLEQCRGRYLAVIDGDGQFPMEAVITCFIRILGGDIDLVQTYRVHREDGTFRRTLSTGFNTVARSLFPGMQLRDINSKPKIMTRDLFQRLKLKDDGWFIDAEIVLKANLLGARIHHEPIHFYRLKGRQSFVQPVAILEFASKLRDFRRRLPEIRRELELEPEA